MDEYNPRSGEYQEFLDKKHGKLVTPDDIIEDAIKTIVGSSLVSKTRITKGEANEVYSGKTTDGQEIIIRISHENFAKFEREKWAIEQCIKAEVPVPKVIGIKDYGQKGNHLNFCIETPLEGKPLDEIPELREPNKKSLLDDIMKQAGEVLSKIHSVKTDGYGEFDRDGHSDVTSIKDFFLGNFYLSIDNMLEVAKKADLESEVMRKAVGLLNNGASDYALESSQLTHGDWSPKHIFIKDNRISGIIDFECAEGSDPVKDFAYWEYFSDDPHNLDFMKAGYANKKVFDQTFYNRLHLWRLYIGVTTLGYYVEENHTSGIRHSKEKLKQDTSR